MFVIVHNSAVVLGPMDWKKLLFQNFILEEFDLAVVLPQTASFDQYIVSDEIKIVKAVHADPEPFNSLTHFLHGPFWDIDDSLVTGSFVVTPYPLEHVKGKLSAIVAENRWKKEVSGVQVTINNTVLSVDTTRDGRGIYLQALQANLPSTRWKFPEQWVDLTPADLSVVVNAVIAHVKNCFDWESAKNDEINAAQTTQELLAINLEP